MKHLIKGLHNDKKNKKEVLELMNNLFKDLINDCIENARELDIIIQNLINE